MSFIYPKLSKHAQLLFEKVNQISTLLQKKNLKLQSFDMNNLQSLEMMQ